MTVSLLEILAAARAHAAPLAAESAGYLLLAAADHVALAPRSVSAEDVELLQDGSVRLRARRGVNDDQAVERGLRALLTRALEVSSSVGPALRRASERRELVGLSALVRELESSLIPVNRSAAKRALSRLHRETERARDSGKLDAALAREAERAVAAQVVEPLPVFAAASPLVAEPVLAAEEFPEPSPAALPVALPAVVAAPAPAPPVVKVAPPAVVKVAPPAPVLTLTPEPQIAVGEPAFTKPEPVVLRKRERGSRTPQLGTLITAQTLPGEEGELTERAPAVEELEAAAALEPELHENELELEDELELEIDVELEEPAVAASAQQPLLDPEPSRMPDVVLAMVELHTGVDADEAPTRLRDVVTAVAATPAPRAVAVAEPVVAAAEPVVAVAEPSFELFRSELAAPELHEALTWDPGPVQPHVVSSLPAAFLIAEPSPYAPAVLPARSSDVSELLDSFYVSGAAEEHELRSALKEMAGLSLTPMPVPLIEEG